MFPSFQPTNLPPSYQQPRNNVSSFYYHASTNDQTFEFDVEDILDSYMIDQSSYGDGLIEQNPLVLQEMGITDATAYKDHSCVTAYNFGTYDQNFVMQKTITGAGSSSRSPHNSINVPFMSQPDDIHIHIDEAMRDRVRAGLKVALRMKTQLEVVDDGYKWRKYGKKKLKSNPNPRNYFKCATVGCKVKKRIERDIDDSRYVITTYDGVHNHKSYSMGNF